MGNTWYVTPANMGNTSMVVFLGELLLYIQYLGNNYITTLL